MIATQLESTLSYTVKQKAYNCAIRLLAEKKKHRENKVKIVKVKTDLTLSARFSAATAVICLILLCMRRPMSRQP